jgi:acyl-CoA dehydrogenase
MSELREMAEQVFADAWDVEATGLDAELWKTLEQTGLARLTLPEEAGGSGGTLADWVAVVTAAGQYAARVPLVETELAAWLLHSAGLEVPTGPLSVAQGSLHRVPWGRAVGGVVLLESDRVSLVDPTSGQVVEGANVAEEPRDTLDGATTVAEGTAPSSVAVEFPLRAALGRSLLIAGAARAALAMSVRYATERVQFGRPIAKLQAIQQTLALAGAEVAAAEAASEAAAGEAQRLGFPEAALAIAAAKARSGEAAGQVARIAHQVHGAIGFTREHPLRLATTRLWAWRDEDGTDTQWNARIGARAVEAGPDALWHLIAGTP